MKPMNQVFVEISLILVAATIVATLMQLLRQPLIIGHILTGLLVGPHFLNLIHSQQTLEIFSGIGVALLLFIIGLSLNPRVVREVGKAALVTGFGQITFTVAAGFGLATWLGYGWVSALYIAIAISFSSTIIIMKLLADKKELGRLYGRISTGFLLVQDLVATLVLISVTSLSRSGNLTSQLGASALKAVVLLGSFFLVTVYILPRVSGFFARSQEFLFLFSIAWGIGGAALFTKAGLSIEIGALFAGIALAASPYSYEISSRMRPLRDFFIIVFFILLGAQMSLGGLGAMLLPAAVFSALILIGNPIIVMALMRFLGYTKKTNFKAGLAVAQISEFSLILVVLGNRVGHIPADITALITVVALFTIAASTYMIIYADNLYKWLEPALGIFERKNARREYRRSEVYDVILFGYERAGVKFAKSFKDLGHKFLVIDFNPDVIAQLRRRRIPCRYGAADDIELLEELNLPEAKMVLSTIRDFGVNKLIADHVRQVNPQAILVLTADEVADAAVLYESGASYVLMPHFLASSKAVGLIEKHGFDLGVFIKERIKHLEYLEEQGFQTGASVNG